MNENALIWKVIRGELDVPRAAAALGWTFVGYFDETKEAHVLFANGGDFTNAMGYVQGGILSAMLDDAMGPALYLQIAPDTVAVTIESKTSYLRPARPGKIAGVGKVEHMTASVAFTSGVLRDSEDNVIATATATFFIKKGDVAVGPVIPATQ
ncbi:uncharacterized protein (TIGR00369 family) [Luteibacter rhizovicinus]|uniref:Uncharacterized protein (TIGR00369 family) n=1 Tax=Luteibacter rhizovicinus TaxID=242606 RepID=A0A4R3YJB1_9GAMM|nr:PaaI family thioesterase [Luteibacter rhizovicinus]TCV91458.1 uncharacterized protein (TIGR00369 family) [Luteibacter rhizovicinus]